MTGAQRNRPVNGGCIALQPGSHAWNLQLNLSSPAIEPHSPPLRLRARSHHQPGLHHPRPPFRTLSPPPLPFSLRTPRRPTLSPNHSSVASGWASGCVRRNPYHRVRRTQTHSQSYFFTRCPSVHEVRSECYGPRMEPYSWIFPW